MKNTFKRNWILYNTIAIFVSLLTLFYIPIAATLLVVIGQAIMLNKKVGPRAFIWLLNPFLFGFSCMAYQLGIPFGIIANALALELIFLASTGRFSYFKWSGIVAIPTSLFWLFSRFGPLSIENWWVTGSLFLILTTILWWLEALYLNNIFKQETDYQYNDSEILDAELN